MVVQQHQVASEQQHAGDEKPCEGGVAHELTHGSALPDPRPAPAPDPEAQTRRGQAAAFVRAFLEELDPDKREVFELAELEGLPIPELAELVGINLNTAYSRLRAARQLFQRAVDRIRAADERRLAPRSQTA